MDFFAIHMNGVRLVPIWSVRDEVKWCSVGGAPFDIPSDANDYVLQSTHEGFEDVLRTEDSESYAAYFNPDQHWLGWSPNQPLGQASSGDVGSRDPAWVACSRDPAWFVFDHADVDLDEHRIDDLNLGGSEHNLFDPRGTLVGYFLSRSWRNTVSHFSERIRNVSEILASSTSWYGRNSKHRTLGPMPASVDRRVLERLVETAEEASSLTRGVRSEVASQLGWLSWFTAVDTHWESSLVTTDLDFVRSLELAGRTKRGFLYNLSQDYHELNFRLLMIFNVPFHFAWTVAEESTGRFIRCNPKFLSEYEDLASRGDQVDLAGLPSYAEWKLDLERYDRFFQDTQAGRVGHLTSFAQHWDYQIINFSHYGARPLDSCEERRVCAERFKGTVVVTRERDGTLHTTCTLFRQNPIHLDEPPNLRRQPNLHPFPLDTFGWLSGNSDVDEYQLFFQEAIEVQELWRTRCAPRLDRAFSTYNGSVVEQSLAITPAPSGLQATELRVGRGSHLEMGRREEKRRRPENPMSPTRSRVHEQVGEGYGSLGLSSPD
ncbi:hypothetical protein K438DRAFT_2147786 [Mycena galopus ATCC 62051]|nr:hypothetical protein K438DRAFT_2147786 [Mycena galopus ATCC 62051]